MATCRCGRRTEPSCLVSFPTGLDYPDFMWGLIHGVHGGIVIYDAIGKTGPTIIASADDGTWQRLAP